MKVAVVGATGLVGRKMLQVLEERNFPVTELIPVASERSVGKEITFKGKNYKVMGMRDAINMKPQLAIFSAGERPHWNGHPNSPQPELPWSTTRQPGEWTRRKNW